VERIADLDLERQALVKRVLAKRISLRAIVRIASDCKLVGASYRIQRLCQEGPKKLPLGALVQAELQFYCLDADEMWIYVGAQDCPVWLWVTIERRSGPVVGLHLGTRDEESALRLWLNIPATLRQKALVFTNDLASLCCRL
jgi:hypothetical protein